MQTNSFPFFAVHLTLLLFQDVSLPKLPVPSLEKTLEKYEKHLEPILDENGKKRAKNIIDEFRSNLGPKLQLYLLERQQKYDNWVCPKFNQ